MEGQPWNSNEGETAVAIQTNDVQHDTANATAVAAPLNSVPAIVLADGLTIADVDEVVCSVSHKAIKELKQHPNKISITFHVNLNPREEYVLVRAWRIISARLLPVRIEWENNTNKPRLVLHATITPPNVEFNTLDGRGNMCCALASANPFPPFHPASYVARLLEQP
jgi:hypothetical protein